MLRASTLVRKPAVKEDRVADTAWLDHKARSSAKAAVKGHGGLEVQLDLDRAAVLNDGDAVKLEDGRLVQVRAAPEPLIEVRAENPLRLLRFAWHLGQRHAPAEIKPEAIFLLDDPVLAELARGQGCSVMPLMRPFNPERTEDHACEHHGHGHKSHHHGHPHDHDAHDHDHAGHQHGPECGHDHGHHEH
jgi:urease accessory protein